MLLRLATSVPVLLLASTLLACSGAAKKAYQSETFEAETPFQFHSNLPPLLLCDFGKRALLSQGYDVDASAPQSIRGQKFFQPQPDLQVQLKITLVCLPMGEESTMYANALQTRHELKAGGSNTGLSVAGIGSISVPWPTDKNALVKVGEETISDPEFYRRLFMLIDTLKE